MLVVYKKPHISWSCPKRNWWKLRNTLTYHNFMLWYVRKQLLSCFLVLASYITNWQRLSPILKKKKIEKQNGILEIFQGIQNKTFPSKNSSELFCLLEKQFLSPHITTKTNLLHYINSEVLQYHPFILNLQAIIFWIVRESLGLVSENIVRENN